MIVYDCVLIFTQGRFPLSWIWKTKRETNCLLNTTLAARMEEIWTASVSDSVTERQHKQDWVSWYFQSPSDLFVKSQQLKKYKCAKSSLIIKFLTMVFVHFVNTWYVGCKSNPRLRATRFSWHFVKLSAETSEMRKRILTFSLAKPKIDRRSKFDKLWAVYAWRHPGYY
jgi:hypothetical protein